MTNPLLSLHTIQTQISIGVQYQINLTQPTILYHTKHYTDSAYRPRHRLIQSYYTIQRTPYSNVNKNNRPIYKIRLNSDILITIHKPINTNFQQIYNTSKMTILKSIVIKNLKSHNPHLKKQHHISKQIQHQLIHLTIHLTNPIKALITQPQTGSASRPRHIIKQTRHSQHHTSRATFSIITMPIQIQQTHKNSKQPKHIAQIKTHELKYILNPHSNYQPHPKNATASAYQPRHKSNNTYQFINNWKPNSITSHKYINKIKSHFSPKQIENIIPAIPNLFTTTKFKITIYLKTNMKNPKTVHSHGYYFINKLELLKCGDIEPNPGPMPNILHTHPATHKKRANIYFIPNTIKLQPEYQHIANTFAPILKNTHPLHPQAITTYPHLHQYIQIQRQIPPTHILYALVITIHLSIDTCNNILAQPQNYHFNDIWTNTLIIRLANLTNPPERHILTPHPYTTFVENN